MFCVQPLLVAIHSDAIAAYVIITAIALDHSCPSDGIVS